MGIGETELPCPICKTNHLADIDGVYECMNCGSFEDWKEVGTKEKPHEILFTTIPLPIGLLQTSAYGRRILRNFKKEAEKNGIPQIRENIPTGT